jgi:triacylglycerol esterase/lipase EstA (alpha/beta hydrolase family)
MRSPVGPFRARHWRCLSEDIDQASFAHKHTELRDRLGSIKLQLDPVDRSHDLTLKDLRKTCATYYDEHVPESSVEILGHSVGGITYCHYAHRAPLAFKAIMTLPQPTAFSALMKGCDGECPCCRRRFDDAG